MSIYNTGRYLNDSIDSIINQSIGIENIQLILINDGSIDNSENICLKYKQYYPNNIIYIKISHSGPSKARNIGLSYAKGKYINFLDSDDKWDKNSFRQAFLFFKFNKMVDIIGSRIKFFEASNGYHFLDYKFIKTRIVNLDKEYSNIQLHCSSSFFRYSAIIKNRFDENLFYGEDVKFISNLLLNKPILGILREAIYYYRKRADFSSALQNSYKSHNYFFQVLENIQIYLINKSKQIYNKIIPFINFYISYELLFRIGGTAQNYLDKKNYKKYCYLIKFIIEQIDEKYILEQKIFSSKIKILALSLKNSRDIRNDIIIKNSSLIYSNYRLMDLKDYGKIISWKIIEIENNKLYLKGEEKFWLPKDKYYYYCKIGHNIFYPRYLYYEDLDFIALGGAIIKGRIISFDITLEIKGKEKLFFYIVYDSNIIEIFPSLFWTNHLPPVTKSFYSTKNYIIRNENNYLFIYNYESFLVKKFENEYQKKLKELHKDYSIKIRGKYFEEKEKNKFKDNNQIWLINDKRNQAGDNGEYFFRYLLKKKPKGILFYFVLEGNCYDYRRLINYGDIIDLKSKKYLNLFLKSDKIISSSLEEWAYNPFERNGIYLKDLYHFEFIYLQSGINEHNFIKYINSIKLNFNMIVTPSKKQYNYFLKMGYNFNNNNIILTGFTRFDYIKRIESDIKTQKIILIYPTFGLNIKGFTDYFNSAYFTFYNNLTNNDNLLSFMKKKGYKGILYLNPNFNYHNKEFTQNKIFKVVKKVNEKELFLKAALLITDYSDSFLDFGYMNKPIIYSQFDYKEYKSNNKYKGYFDYENDGFGPVCYDLNCIINNIILVIKNNNRIKGNYLRRIKRFYKYSRENNCERTYLKIKENNNKGNILKEYLYIRIYINAIFFFTCFLFIIKLYTYVNFYIHLIYGI